MWQPRGGRWAATGFVLAVATGRPAGRPVTRPDAAGQATRRRDIPAAQPASVPGATLREGTLSFDGHATTGDFVGRTTRVTGAVLTSPDYASVRGWVEAPVTTLTTGNGLRDRDLRKSMETERYPTVRYDLAGATVRSAAGDSAHLLLHGTFQAHGVSRVVDVPVTVARSGASAHVVGTFPVNLADYRIGGLRKMAGLLRMRDGIEVHLDLHFAADRGAR